MEHKLSKYPMQTKTGKRPPVTIKCQYCQPQIIGQGRGRPKRVVHESTCHFAEPSLAEKERYIGNHGWYPVGGGRYHRHPHLFRDPYPAGYSVDYAYAAEKNWELMTAEGNDDWKFYENGKIAVVPKRESE